jgi:hypothetical protein
MNPHMGRVEARRLPLARILHYHFALQGSLH